MSTRFKIIFWGIIISLNSNGQNKLERSPFLDLGKAMIGANISPDYCNRTLRIRDKTQITKEDVQAWNRLDMHKFGYTFGLNASYYFTKRLRLETGLQVSNKGFATRKLTASYLIVDSSGFPQLVQGSGDLPVSTKFYYDFHYLDLPLRTVFTFGKRKIHFISSVGLTINILLNATKILIKEYDDGSIRRQTIKEQYNFKFINLSPSLSTGMEFLINKRSNLRLESVFKFGIIGINDGPMATHLWTLGLNISYYYMIKNN